MKFQWIKSVEKWGHWRVYRSGLRPLLQTTSIITLKEDTVRQGLSTKLLVSDLLCSKVKY